MTWKEFRKLVDRHVSKLTCGLGTLDMADVCFYDYFPEGDESTLSDPEAMNRLAKEAANYVVDENGFYDGFPLD